MPSFDIYHIKARDLFDYFDNPAVRSSSPPDRERSPYFTRITCNVVDTPMVSQDVSASPAQVDFMTCSTAKCPNLPSSNAFKRDLRRNIKSLIEHKQRQALLGRSSAPKRKHKSRKALANKKHKPGSNPESFDSTMIDATLQDHISHGNSQAVSLSGGHPI